MGALDTAKANNTLNALLATAAFAASIAPMRVRLMTTNGTANTNGVEVAGGGYTSQTVTFSTASAGQALSNAAVTFANMPNATVVGVEIWDSAPKRIAWGALAVPKTTSTGDSLTINGAALSLAFT